MDKTVHKKAAKKKHSGWMLAVAIILLVIAFPFMLIGAKYVFGLAGFDYVYSEGTRIGQVVKLSERGLIWKTQEGSLGVTQSGAYVERWDFSIDSRDKNKDQLLAVLVEASRTGSLVEIKYSQRIGVRPWRAKTSYLVESVSILR